MDVVKNHTGKLMVLAYLANSAGILLFVMWYSESDGLLGSYSGSSVLLGISLTVLLLALIISFLCVLSGLSSFANKPVGTKVSMISSAVTLALLIYIAPVVTCFLFGSFEILANLGLI